MRAIFWGFATFIALGLAYWIVLGVVAR